MLPFRLSNRVHTIPSTSITVPTQEETQYCIERDQPICDVNDSKLIRCLCGSASLSQLHHEILNFGMRLRYIRHVVK